MTISYLSPLALQFRSDPKYTLLLVSNSIASWISWLSNKLIVFTDQITTRIISHAISKRVVTGNLSVQSKSRQPYYL
ncbi:hypothetical protein Peur_046733 [Populus x canadensis]